MVLLSLLELVNLAYSLANNSDTVDLITPPIVLSTYVSRNPRSEALSPLIKCSLSLQQVLMAALTVYEVKFGFSTSVLQFVFWGLYLISATFLLRSQLLEFIHRRAELDFPRFVLFFGFYGLLLIAFLLSLFTEKSASSPKSHSHSNLVKFACP